MRQLINNTYNSIIVYKSNYIQNNKVEIIDNKTILFDINYF